MALVRLARRVVERQHLGAGRSGGRQGSIRAVLVFVFYQGQNRPKQKRNDEENKITVQHTGTAVPRVLLGMNLGGRSKQTVEMRKPFERGLARGERAGCLVLSRSSKAFFLPQAGCRLFLGHERRAAGHTDWEACVWMSQRADNQQGEASQLVCDRIGGRGWMTSVWDSRSRAVFPSQDDLEAVWSVRACVSCVCAGGCLLRTEEMPDASCRYVCTEYAQRRWWWRQTQAEAEAGAGQKQEKDSAEAQTNWQAGAGLRPDRG